jgi:hypothetical protein
MTIIPFVRRAAPAVDGWPTSELSDLVRAVAPELRSGHASGWDTGLTETGDPQFYLIGPPPQHDCILCVSRLGRLYLLEDGAGQVMFENGDFELLAEQAKTLLKTGKTRMLAQIVLAWGILRQAFEEKLEPLLVEGEELLTHFAPQLAAMA